MHPAGENEKKSAAMDELRANVLELRVFPNEEQAKAGNGEDVDDDEERFKPGSWTTNRSWLKTKLPPKLRETIRTPCSQQTSPRHNTPQYFTISTSQNCMSPCHRATRYVSDMTRALFLLMI